MHSHKGSPLFTVITTDDSKTNTWLVDGGENICDLIRFNAEALILVFPYAVEEAADQSCSEKEEAVVQLLNHRVAKGVTRSNICFLYLIPNINPHSGLSTVEQPLENLTCPQVEPPRSPLCFGPLPV